MNSSSSTVWQHYGLFISWTGRHNSSCIASYRCQDIYVKCRPTPPRLQQVTEVIYHPFILHRTPLLSLIPPSFPTIINNLAVIRVVRSGCSLRNGVGKLPYMAMAPVALATSCPWKKRTHLGGLEAVVLTISVKTRKDFRHIDLCL